MERKKNQKINHSHLFVELGWIFLRQIFLILIVYIKNLGFKLQKTKLYILVKESPKYQPWTHVRWKPLNENYVAYFFFTTEFRKSIKSIFSERVRSSILISGIIWNQKIIYLQFFISESKIKTIKTAYISTNYSEIERLIIYPIISTIVLIIIIFFVSYGA